jgi:hypothetical protein
MTDLLSHLVDAPLANILILAGLGFLAVGVIGKISGKIEPGTGGRIMSGILGAILLVYGIHSHYMSDRLASVKAAIGPGTRTTVGLPPRVVVAAPAPEACVQGYVWREAFAGDRVCVTAAIRLQVAQDNKLAASRRSPNGGPYGADTCLAGFVWREAGPSDHVCVPAADRQQALLDNQAAASHRIGR